MSGEGSLVRVKLAELIQIASRDPASNTIGETVMASIITPCSTSIDFRQFPDTPNWIGSNYVGPNMSIAGVKVTNDFIEGGITKIGPHKLQDLH